MSAGAVDAAQRVLGALKLLSDESLPQTHVLCTCSLWSVLEAGALRSVWKGTEGLENALTGRPAGGAGHTWLLPHLPPADLYVESWPRAEDPGATSAMSLAQHPPARCLNWTEQ